MSRYRGSGHGYLVCPRLLELDGRHGEHGSRGPACRHGLICLLEHEHESRLEGEGHRKVDFYWLPDCRPPVVEDGDLVCACGRRLVHADLDDPQGAEYLIEEASEGGA